MTRVYVTMISVEFDDELDYSLSPDVLLEEKIHQLMDLLDMDEAEATRLYLRIKEEDKPC